MLTKYHIEFEDGLYELAEDDLKNWSEIKCSYKRDDYGGVVRSFSSKFEFANTARDLLLRLYLRDRFAARASFAVYTIDNRWEYHKQFECPFDFSSVTWDKTTLSISTSDNGLASAIKAYKSTKYEFPVNKLRADGKFYFDRIPMDESITYEFTDGDSYADCADLKVTFVEGELPWVGNVGDETVINHTIDWLDDQDTAPGSYVFKAMRDITVGFDYQLSWRKDEGVHLAHVGVRVRRGNGDVSGAVTEPGISDPWEIAYIGKSWELVGTFDNIEPLQSITAADRKFAIVNGIVYGPDYTGSGFRWKNTGMTREEFCTESANGHRTIALKSGDEVYIYADVPNGLDYAVVRVVRSQFRFSWTARGDAVDIPVLSPRKVASALLREMSEGVFVSVSFSGHDTRVANTYLFAAESARGLDGAKLYTSFNEFTDWMAAVFGYIYTIGDSIPSRYTHFRRFGRIVGTPYSGSSHYDGEVDTDNILYNSSRKCFFYHASDGYHDTWPGHENYNNLATGMPRTDTVFGTGGRNYVFDAYDASVHGNYLNPRETDMEEKHIGLPEQEVRFLHRSEVFDPSSEPYRFSGCTGVSYKVSSSDIYSAVTVGYDAKEYEGINGRDEFNFGNTYTTGCDVSDKTLSILSKYRADCYGIEFAVQKRGEDTTDNSSDKDVFFVLCSKDSGNLVADRSIAVEGARSDAVFNAAFSPMACARANAGIICLQASPIKLTFASSTGNSTVTVGPDPMTGDLTLTGAIATCATLEFTAEDVYTPVDLNCLMEVEDNGTVYKGYLQDVDVVYGRVEASKYKIIVKEIEIL